MSYFILDDIIELNQFVTVKGAEALHLIKSRRVEPGDLLEIQDNSHKRYLAKVKSVARKELDIVPVKAIEPPPESRLGIHLCQALVKEKAMDFIIQKTTELGVASILVFQSAYSQRLKKDHDKQVSRWQKISWEACKQSGRCMPPSINFYCDLPALARATIFKNIQIPALCMETREIADSIPSLNFPVNRLNVLIGPEGGWQKGELDLFNPQPVKLGPRILRADTAAVAVVSILQFRFGDMGM